MSSQLEERNIQLSKDNARLKEENDKLKIRLSASEGRERAAMARVEELQDYIKSRFGVDAVLEQNYDANGSPISE